MKVSDTLLQRSSEEEFAMELDTLANASACVIHIRTDEVMRAIIATRKTVLVNSNKLYEWDIHRGQRKYELTNMHDLMLEGDGNVDVMEQFAKPLTELTAAEGEDKGALRFYVFVGMEHFLTANAPLLGQLLLEQASVLPASNSRVVIITPDEALPEPLCTHVTSMRLLPPSHQELIQSFTTIITEGIDEQDAELLDTMLEEDLRRIAYAGSGMGLEEFELHASLTIARSVYHRGDDDEGISRDDLVAGINRGKTEIINRNDLLELYPVEDMSLVGGMDNLKEWVNKRALCYTDEAAEAGVEPPKGLVAVGPPGCLAGETQVDYRRGKRNSSRPITLEELYRKFNGIPTGTRGWDVTLPTYLHSLMPDGTIAYNRIIAVVEAGIKPVLRVEVEDGEPLILTGDHPIARPDGTFTPSGDLTSGDEILRRGSMLAQSSGGRMLDARPPRVIVNLNYHPYGSLKDTDHYLYRRVPNARLVVEAHMNDTPLDEFIHILRRNKKLADTLKFLDPSLEVHHVDEDTMNDEISNLMVYSKEEHARIHGKVENLNVEYVLTAKVTDVVVLSESIMTYDVQMDMPANNFVANGTIVHNTGKSLCAKAIAGVLGVPLVRLDFGKVFNSLVGKSEERMRKALSMVESMSPCVLFVDEIDKGLGGIGGSGDSGTSNRILGTFLTWLNDCEEPVFTVVTANNVTALPPELLRRGRFDAIFSTGLPTVEERREVLRIHLAKRGKDIGEYGASDVQAFLNASAGYVPAEIESAVKDGLIDAFSEQEPFDVTWATSAIEIMVPLSKAFNEVIQAMTLWAKSNATPASRGYEETDKEGNVIPIKPKGKTSKSRARRVSPRRSSGSKKPPTDRSKH